MGHADPGERRGPDRRDRRAEGGAQRPAAHQHQPEARPKPRRTGPRPASGAYPGLEVWLETLDRRANLVEEGIHLDIRVGEASEPNLIAHRIAESARVLCAAPSYLGRRGTPRTFADVARHDCLVFRDREEPFGVWRLDGPNGAETAKVTGPMAANHTDIVLGWAHDGHGIVLVSLSGRPRQPAGRASWSAFCRNGASGPTSGRSPPPASPRRPRSVASRSSRSISRAVRCPCTSDMTPDRPWTPRPGGPPVTPRAENSAAQPAVSTSTASKRLSSACRRAARLSCAFENMPSALWCRITRAAAPRSAGRRLTGASPRTARRRARARTADGRTRRSSPACRREGSAADR